MKNNQKKKFLIIGIEIVLGLMHVVGIGRYSSERMFTLSASYFSDLALPFGFYFLLALNEEKTAFLQKWWMKAGIVFLMAAFVEVGQYFGFYILGRTFDPIDIAVYASGVLLAVLVDWIFSIVFKFWKTGLLKIINTSTSRKKIYT
jgi:cell shape-determining protein MreD